MQDVKLCERAIRVGRPTNTDQYQEIMDSTIEKSKNQPILYVSNIHSAVVEDDLRQIFSPFGDIVNCVLIKDYITGRHKTYGFVEFTTVKVSFYAFMSHKSENRVPWTPQKPWTCSSWMASKSASAVQCSHPRKSSTMVQKLTSSARLLLW